MQVLRLLAARRRLSTLKEDEGPFFDLDLSSLSSSSSDDSDDACSSDLDFVISLHRSRSDSPSFRHHHHQLCASEPINLRTLSFGANKKSKKAATFYGGRASFASSTRSLRLFVEMESPLKSSSSEPSNSNKNQSGDVIRRYLTKILRNVRPRPAAGDTRGLHRRRLRKSRSAVTLAPPARRDDSLIEKQDGIASAIAHCKESFHRASLSECDSSLLRSRSDPGKCEASSSYLAPAPMKLTEQEDAKIQKRTTVQT